jgi:hypothetical protein
LVLKEILGFGVEGSGRGVRTRHCSLQGSGITRLSSTEVLSLIFSSICSIYLLALYYNAAVLFFMPLKRQTPKHLHIVDV